MEQQFILNKLEAKQVLYFLRIMKKEYERDIIAKREPLITKEEHKILKSLLTPLIVGE